MRQTFDCVTLIAEGKVAIIALDQPDTINALSEAMVADLNAALDAVEAGGFRALVLTGTGRGFCSGADMKELPARRVEGAGKVLEQLFHPLFRRLRDFDMPIVTAVNGPAVGIGMSLALMGDLIVAGASAYFLLSFSRIGLVPDGGITWTLPRLIGLTRARELALLADPLPAEKALEWGLINRVIDDARLMEEARALAKRLADGPAALPLTRKLFWDHESHEAQLAREADAQQKAGITEDFAEGLAAFQAKREPKFSGK
ncbi:MAG TPA: enoyl-CoA hydratase-related protein [Rhizomicrobium sp.]|nr:enoyl-CoA hydratase-related protein [Rhizomicrobium sp.]